MPPLPQLDHMDGPRPARYQSIHVPWSYQAAKDDLTDLFGTMDTSLLLTIKSPGAQPRFVPIPYERALLPRATSCHTDAEFEFDDLSRAKIDNDSNAKTKAQRLEAMRTITRRPNQASNARLLVNTQKLPADTSERSSNINAVPISVIMSYPLSANVQSAPNAAPFQVTPACIQVPQSKDTTTTANPTKKSDKHDRGNANHGKLEESQTDRSRSRSSNNSELHACRTLGINTLTANDYGNGNARQADSHHHNSCAHPVNRAPAGPWPYPLRVRALRGQIHRDQSTAKERVKRWAEKRQTCRTRSSLLVQVVDATNIDIQPSAPIVSASGSPTYPGIEDPEALKTWVARSLAERYGRESWP